MATLHRLQENRGIDFTSSPAAVHHKQVSDKNVSSLLGLLRLERGGREIEGDTSVSLTVISN